MTTKKKAVSEAVEQAVGRKREHLVIAEPNMQIGEFTIIGASPYVQHAFYQKAALIHDQEQGTKVKSKKRAARDFAQEGLDARHLDEEGHQGIPAAAFRNALIDACRGAGFVMTKAKMSLFCLHTGIDPREGTPLVRFEGEPEYPIHHVRLESGVVSLVCRPMWKRWSATVRLRWDGDQFHMQDVAHLLMRAGMQIGIGEGRPYSKKSAGMGWGTFELAMQGSEEIAA